MTCLRHDSCLPTNNCLINNCQCCYLPRKHCHYKGNIFGSITTVGESSLNSCEMTRNETIHKTQWKNVHVHKHIQMHAVKYAHVFSPVNNLLPPQISLSCMLLFHSMLCMLLQYFIPINQWYLNHPASSCYRLTIRYINYRNQTFFIGKLLT